MRIAVLLVLMLGIASVVSAKSIPTGILTIPTAQCVYHSGDNPSWAAPNLQETGWKPYSTWALGPVQPHIWVRCHADLTALRNTTSPAIQVTVQGAYQLYLNQVLIGGAGNLDSGDYGMDITRSFPLPEALLSSQPSILAARISYRHSHPVFNPLIEIHATALEIQAGDQEVLNAVHSSGVWTRVRVPLIDLAIYGAIGVIGFVLLGLFLYDRSRPELLLLSVYCILLIGIYGIRFSFAAQADYPSSLVIVIWVFLAYADYFALTWFFFTLARRRVPLLFWILVALAFSQYLLYAFGVVLPAEQALRLEAISFRWILPISIFAREAIATAPFVAFWPYQRIARRMRPLAVLTMMWGATYILIASADAAAQFDMQSLSRWLAAAIGVRAFVQVCLITALMGLLLREHRRAVVERAELAGEMLAASQIQRMLAPATLDCAPGLEINVAFHPMREVGGDFYLCRVLPNGSQRIVFGDVSGKGNAAAMTAALLLGGAADHDDASPSQLLAHLNRVLRDSHISGFATCLCAEIAASGQVVLANAGHLAPYIHGEEVELPGGLPLGISLQAGDSYMQLEFALSPGETITFLSDGVVEARNSSGELFGFERTRSISIQSAEQIANTAESHGQEDDITVLTVTFAPA